MQQNKPREASIFSISAPSDLQWLERWEAHLYPLAQAGLLSVSSVRHVQAGIDRRKALHDYQDQADILILLLSADFFIDDECEALMERALQRYQQGSVRLIPLLLRPVAFRETQLAPLTPWPSDGSPVTQWHDPEAAFDDCVRELRRILGRPVTAPLAPRKKRVSVEAQNRARMLQRLQHTYEELFTQSLQGVTQIELGLASKSDAVQNAATLLFRAGTRPEQVLPPGTSILHIYDESTHDLLILGAPGAGKSTLLVELARRLVIRAEADETHPLPVILPLSSWAVKRPRLEIWLAEQVAQIYAIPKKIARLWIDEDQLLPLLDGLDEMDEAARPDCIAAINAYHRDHLRLSLVVCSRQSEYEEASKSQRLALQNAVVIQPLTHEHVQAYLKQGGKPLTALRRALTANTALAGAVTTPLMVHVLILTYQGTKAGQLPARHEQLQQQVWNDYVQRMIERKSDAQHYPVDRAITRLSWLAQQMRDHNQSIFYLEQLQPDWLAKKQRIFYRWSIGPVSGLVSGLVFGLVGGLVGGVIKGLTSGLVSGLLFGLTSGLSSGKLACLLFGLCIGLAFGLKAKIEPSEMLTWSWGKLKSWLFFGLFIGLLAGLSVGLFFGPLVDPVFETAGGLLFGLLFGLFCPRTKTEPVEAFIWSSRKLKSGLVGGGVGGLLIGLHVWQHFGPRVGLPVDLVIGLLFGLFIGSRTKIEPVEAFIGAARKLKSGLASGEVGGWIIGGVMGVVPGVVMGLLIGLLIGSLTEPTIGLLIGIPINLVIWLALGLSTALSTKQLTERLMLSPNEGIRRSLKNGLVLGLFFWLLIGLLFGLGIGLTGGLTGGLVGGIFFGLFFGLLEGLSLGLGAAIQHYTLRIFLWQTHTFPWKAQRFLDDAVTCILLRRVGGGYSFVHRLLMEHLADSTEHSKDAPSTSITMPSESSSS